MDIEMRFGLLADHVSETREGKLNIMGEFNSFATAAEFPLQTPPFFLIARFAASVAEGSDHTLDVLLVHEDGKTIASLLGLPFRFFVIMPGHPMKGQFQIQMVGVTFPAPGDYTFRLVVDGKTRGEIPVSAHRVRQPPLESAASE